MVSVSLSHYPKNVGILALEMYFPKRYVSQSDMEKFDGVSEGKYTIGLMQHNMAFVDDREDIHSICLTVVKNLLEKYSIDPQDVGRLEVGTETIIDKSKSVKTVLMQLFAEQGNTEIEGIDTTNACYGGTNALFNAINWVESSSWDGRYAIVVAGDLAIYASGSARPTSGAGVVAMLIGKDAPIILERGLRATHMEHVYDFYKPDLSSEYPTVDGRFSNICYLRSFDITYQRYMKKLAKQEHIEAPSQTVFDYFAFHSPYCKLVQKSVARMAYNDFLLDPENEKYASLKQFKSLNVDASREDKLLEKALVTLTKDYFKSSVLPSLHASQNIGNMYCAAVYSCLSSIISEVPAQNLLNKRIGVFSYGSGSAASLFSLRVVGSTAEIAKNLSLKKRLESRTRVTPEAFDAALATREHTHNAKDYSPVGLVESIDPGTYYLTKVDAKFRRFYERVPQ